MTQTALWVEGISKAYRIQHRSSSAERLVYHDVLTGVRAIWNSLRRKNRPKIETFWALRDVTFSVNESEVLGIIGKNGAGKSTLLKILSRITDPTSGSARIFGRLGSLLEVGTGFNPELTGRENIFLNGTILGMSHKEIRRQFDAIVDFSEIEQFIDTPVKHYSSGMYVRLGFAIAAHLDPEILIIDEVLAVGDVAFQRKCLNKMKQISSEGRTVLFVSHNLNSVKQLCSRGIVLHQGRIIFDGEAATAVNRYMQLDLSDSSSQHSWTEQNAPGNDLIRLLKVQLTDKAGIPRDKYSSDERINVEFTYRLYRSTSGFDFRIALYNSEGIYVLYSSQCDDPVNVERGYTPGVYTSICTLPPFFLNEDSYFIVIHGGHTRLPALTGLPRLTFSVSKGTNSYGVLRSERSGVIAPDLDWKIEMVEALTSNL
jgi:lipopolysaccharide transport system ATP-binding protein